MTTWMKTKDVSIQRLIEKFCGIFNIFVDKFNKGMEKKMLKPKKCRYILRLRIGFRKDPKINSVLV